MQTTNVTKSIEIILDDLGYDTSYIDGMSDTDRAEFCRLIAPYVQEWMAPFEPTFVHSIPYIISALCRRFNVPFAGEVEPRFVRKPKNKAVRTW